MGMGVCRSCGAKVVWAKRADGREHPLDPVPFAEGNMKIVNGFIHRGSPGTGPYRSHFASCPHAETWRNGRRPTNGANGGHAA